MSVIKTGLGERLISNDVEGKSFTELPVIDLSRLRSDSVEERRALAAEVRYTRCRSEGPIADYRVPAGPRGEVDSLSLLIRRLPSAHSARSPRLAPALFETSTGCYRYRFLLHLEPRRAAGCARCGVRPGKDLFRAAHGKEDGSRPQARRQLQGLRS